ncbi:MAG: ATP-dependent Clp protease proteolytic subunit [Desulfobulbaceae bacterium]|nr:ATP-dependent Clp protease proteolytic subunit [Desulfobulbaceae bacterium]
MSNKPLNKATANAALHTPCEDQHWLRSSMASFVMLSRKALLLLLIIPILCLLLLHTGPADAEGGSKKIFVIPVSGDVEPAMAAYIERAVQEAGTDPETTIVLELDTFGGRVDSALKIVETMTAIAGPRTIAFVKNKAISAGALIALSCKTLVMQPNTTIGDCAPISFSQEGAKMLGEKFQSPLRAKFRTLARRNGYPVALAEAMVSAHLEIYEVKMADRTLYLNDNDLQAMTKDEQKKIITRKVVVAEDELLTMDDAEARNLGFSKMTAATIPEMLTRLDIKDYQLVRLEPSWSEALGRFLTSIAPILMMIGMAALYAEYKAPGFGLPGLVGLICLGLVLGNQYIVGLADHTEIILLLLGLVLLGFEVFVIPGFGVAGIAGFICIGLGMILSFQDFVLPDPALPWQSDILLDNLTKVLGSFIVAFAAGLIFLSYFFPRLAKLIEGPYLDTTLAASHADSHEAEQVTIGERGTAATFLRPAGKAHFGARAIDVITEGDFIEKGAKVRILAIKGNRVVVSEDL